MRYHNIISSLVFVMILSTSCFAQDEKIKVEVEVWGDDDTKNLVKSFILRELRALNDVLIVNNEPDYSLQIGVMSLKYESGLSAGQIIISYVELQPFKVDYLNVIVDELGFDSNDKQFDKFDNWVIGVYTLKDNKLISCPRESLQEKCAGLIADFDVETLAQQRQIDELLRKYIEEQSEGQ